MEALPRCDTPPESRTTLCLTTRKHAGPRRGRTSHASPPDPTWISGIYDDADYDDVVCLITSGHGTIETVGLANAHPLLPVAGWVSALESDLGPGLSGFSSPSRAPLAY